MFCGQGIVPGLSGVSETMLWPLHNRAYEARRPDGVLKDPQAILIHDAMDYNFHHHFGTPGGSLAARAAQIDRSLREWLTRHPDGQVVSLGEGLETQAARVDNGSMRWLSVDLPQAMALRERFITPGGRFEHLAVQRIVAGLDGACGRLGRDLYYRARLADVSGAGTGGAAVL